MYAWNDVKAMFMSRATQILCRTKKKNKMKREDEDEDEERSTTVAWAQKLVRNRQPTSHVSMQCNHCGDALPYDADY